MLSPRCLRLSTIAFACSLISVSGLSAAEPKQAAELLPPTTVAFAQLTGVDDIAGMVLEHPLRAKLEALDQVKKAYASKEYIGFLGMVAGVESQLGKPWREALKDLTSGGVYVAFDAKSQNGALLVQSADEASLEKLIVTIRFLARANATQNGNEDPIKIGEYRGIQAYRIDQTRLVQLGTWLVVTNEPELGKQIIDNYLDGGKSFASNKKFQQARESRPQEAKLWAYVDIETIRNSGVADQLYSGRADNPVVEMLAGGLLSNLQKTPFLTFALEVESQRITATLQTPHEQDWTPEEREYYFGPEGKGRAPKLLEVENQLFALSTYRDFSQMWLRAGDLFDEAANDELAKADSNLSTFFSGKDFGEDILGALQPGVQLIVAQQTFEGVLPRPAIQLPSFAIVGRLRDRENLQRDLRRVFQNLVGFINVLGAMNGQPQLDLDMQRKGDTLIVSSQYAAEDDEKESTKARINFNFSPSIVFHNDVFVVSSTTTLANEIAERSNADLSDSADNTLAHANIGAIGKALEANKEHLIAQNMLEDGNTREEAEAQIGVILSLLQIVDDVTVRLSPVEKAMRLSLQVRLSETK